MRHLAVTTGCYCGVLPYCHDESASPNKWGAVYAHIHGTVSSIITSHVEDFDDVARHMTCSNESS